MESSCYHEDQSRDIPSSDHVIRWRFRTWHGVRVDHESRRARISRILQCHEPVGRSSDQHGGTRGSEDGGNHRDEDGCWIRDAA